ncbi:trypsin-1-like [Paramacrobiotus metropolitanus]|uniref:trypsin-1-like n=1 Tax=Paramacrobiotus metropolitanus TaxID=2943436 RepID=UPI0024462D1A|nr:trypsin-1-like [Paramacrobiotus metropolitanus]
MHHIHNMSYIWIIFSAGTLWVVLSSLSQLSAEPNRPPPQICGKPQVPPSKGVRIVGGGPVQNNSWPWACALVQEIRRDNRMTYRQFCDCTLIDMYWVVTAGHCKHGLSDAQFEYYVKVYLGEENLLTARDNSARRFNVSRVFLHEKYVHDIKHNDIALIRLSRPVEKFDNDVMPACLPKRPVHDGEFQERGQNGRRIAYLGGWGHTHEGEGKNGVIGSGTDKLKQVSAEVYHHNECLNRLGYRITNTMFCAGFDRGGRDTCQGDSGGPLVADEGNNTWTLHGIVSWGIGCAQRNSPGVYTHVHTMMDWIEQKTGLNFDKFIPMSPTEALNAPEVPRPIV